jgi:hypothetical protein
MAGLVYVPDMIMKREVLPIVPGIRAIFCNDEDSVFLKTGEGKKHP